MFCYLDISILAGSYLVIYYSGFGHSCEESWTVIWINLGFMLFILDIDQYLDVTDFISLRPDVWISYR